MKVIKFGGTSVGSPERLKAILKLIDSEDQKVVVLSAMAGTTDSLVEITRRLFEGEREKAYTIIDKMRNEYSTIAAKLLNDKNLLNEAIEMLDAHFAYIRDFTVKVFSKKQEKAILAQGELISTALFYLYCKEQNADATLITALDFMRIDKDGEPDYYYISENIKREIKEHSKRKIIITQGYICRNAYGEIDNLKRGGSDYSATIIGAALKADEIEIWTDINGIHNNDPRFVEKTSVIRMLSFDEAAELAYFGAKILHPTSVIPARDADIPVRLKNTMDPQDEGTLICSEINGGGYKAIAAKDDITVIKIKSDRMLNAYGFLRKIFEIFEIFKTPIDMITTSEVAVSITIDDVSRLEKIVSELEGLGFVEVEKDKTIICIVGDFIAEKSGTTLEIFNALKGIPIRMISYGGSRHNVSVVVNSDRKREALESLNLNLFNQ
jgi:aspartate kinase